MYRPSARTDMLGLAGIGLAIGLMHLPISLELSVTLSYQSALVRTLIVLLYPLAMALTGLGAVLAMRWPKLARPGVLRVAGLALVALLLASLRLNFLPSQPGPLVAAWLAHVLATGTWFLALGAGQTAMLARIQRSRPAWVGIAWGAHLLGLFLGYLLCEVGVVWIGANAILVCAAVALVASPRWASAVLVVLLPLAVAADLDERLEDLRDLSGDRAQVGANWKSNQFSVVQGEEVTRLHLGWSRYGQVQMLLRPNGKIMALYNLQRQYDFHPNAPGFHLGLGGQRTEARTALYARIQPEDRVIVSGVGAGRGIALIPELSKNVVAVERDPVAARVFGSLHPEYNSGLFQRCSLVNADGRHVIETWPEQVDVISLESSRYQPEHTMLPASAPYFLHTREAIASYLDKLSDQGLLLMEFTRVGETTSHQFVPAQVLNTVEELAPEHVVLRMGELETVLILACLHAGCTEPWVEAVRDSGTHKLLQGWNPVWDRDLPRLTDSRPFASWAGQSKRRKRALLGAGGLLCLLGLGFTGLLAARNRQPRWTAWFFALGVAHTALQLHAFHAWRSFLGDDLRSIWWLVTSWLLVGAAASWAAVRHASWLRPLPTRTALTAGLLALHVALVFAVPFGQPSALLRWGFAALAVLPGGLLMGAWMPLGLHAADRRGLGSWLAADALGTLVAAAAVFVLMVPFGAHAYLALATVLYLSLPLGWRSR